MASSTDELFNIIQSTLPQCDESVVAKKEIQEHFKKNLNLAFKNGVLGCVKDIYNMTHAWQFPLTEIKSPIDVWHGREDKSVGYEIAEYLASELENSTLHTSEKSGHYFIYEKWTDILNTIKQTKI